MKRLSQRRSWLLPVAILMSTMFLASCANTVRGVGKDVRQTVDAVDDTMG